MVLKSIFLPPVISQGGFARWKATGFAEPGALSDYGVFFSFACLRAALVLCSSEHANSGIGRARAEIKKGISYFVNCDRAH